MPLPLLGRVHPALLVLATLAGAAAMLVWRARETRGTVSTRKILLPPLGMSTGFAMFLVPAARVPWAWGSAALAAGALVLSYPLARTSRLVLQGDAVVMQRSKAFLWILLGLLAVRLALRSYVERHVTPLQTGALFFLLAFGMIARWRVAMLGRYLALRAEAAARAQPAGGAVEPS